jgi:hypothetical protein
MHVSDKMLGFRLLSEKLTPPDTCATKLDEK